MNTIYINNNKGDEIHMDANIFQVTEKAYQMIQQFFQEKKETPIIRVFLSQGG